MIKYDYADYLVHKKEHGEFVKRVLEEVKNFEENRQFVPNRFVRFLKDWLLNHIAISDHKFGDFLVSKGVQ
jgi:hemerythrin